MTSNQFFPYLVFTNKWTYIWYFVLEATIPIQLCANSNTHMNAWILKRNRMNRSNKHGPVQITLWYATSPPLKRIFLLHMIISFCVLHSSFSLPNGNCCKKKNVWDIAGEVNITGSFTTAWESLKISKTDYECEELQKNNHGATWKFYLKHHFCTFAMDCRSWEKEFPGFPLTCSKFIGASNRFLFALCKTSRFIGSPPHNVSEHIYFC